jgi:carbonic anhydrase
MFSVLLVLVLLTAFQVSANCLHGTDFYDRSLVKRGSKAAPFGYTDALSPLLWANLDPSYANCATSNVQSPINLDNGTAFSTENVWINITVAQSSIMQNLGTTVEVLFSGTTTLGNSTFNLKQFHFHTPSEHRIKEEHFPLEMHMVHQNQGPPFSRAWLISDGSSTFLVLTVLFELSNGTGLAFIDTIVAGLPAITQAGTNTTVDGLDLTPVIELQTSSAAKYLYSGSLTTPPCSEGVTFLIPETTLPISVEQYKALKSVIKFNSRYTQNKLGEENLLQRAKGNETCS